LKRVASIFIFWIIAFSIQAAKQPATIDEALHYFEKKWSDKQKESFKKLPEEKAVSEHDLSTGIFIRSQWLSNQKNTALLNQFIGMGIDQTHDMSAIILTSLHRKLNNIPIDLEGQVKYFKDYWKPIRICEAAADKLAEENYKKFNIGDSISIYMDVDAKFGTRNAILHECPDTEWSFDYKNDLLIKGIVTDKYASAAEKNVSLKVKILSLSSENTTVFFKIIKPSDEMEFYLRYLLVKGSH
jgi:hypothetical protein